ncbi:amino acid ABC transporter ATP-binding protein [Williamsia maris]|uniref:Amino acid ABC transporter ATP-binding protein, PAAT family n=1 Tax=Williamsia maris TaxID=72806 RepID=A0ABT1HA03_9NOCA|nr:amino acid ABC transporter ATP-binding protein [Williamsia maris]MCP2175086.1 amino acid ABC transporter ATP-binding protein, PAAT family [Williamsia maris]
MTDPKTLHGTDVVEVAGLTKSFDGPKGKPIQVLRDNDFSVAPGSVTVIIGPSGSGKTTMLRSLNALDIPDAGVIRIGEVSVDFADLGTPRKGLGSGRKLTRADNALLARYRLQSGMVFQSHNLFPNKTVLQNVTEGPVIVQKRDAEEARTEAHALLERVGLAEQAEQLPHQLSGGQQQRVGIARALAMKPTVVLFDEPTSALDPELVGDVLGVIKDLAVEGTTMVIVTHEIRFAQQVSNQVLFIDGGAIVERGTPADVIGAPSNERTKTFLKRILDPA